MTALPPRGTPTAPLDPLSEQYEAGRERLGIEPGLDAIDLVEIGDSTMELNMGPMHPSTHGVLRLVLNLDGVPRGIDKKRSFFHHAKLLRIKEVNRLRRYPGMEGREIGPLQQIVKIRHLDPLAFYLGRCDVRIVYQHLHAKSQRPFSNPGTNIAISHQAEYLPS